MQKTFRLQIFPKVRRDRRTSSLKIRRHFGKSLTTGDHRNNRGVQKRELKRGIKHSDIMTPTDRFDPINAIENLLRRGIVIVECARFCASCQNPGIIWPANHDPNSTIFAKW